MTQRLVDAAGALLERRTSRRGLLGRAALTGAAMAIAPLRYLLRPVTAWAVIGPGSCGGGLCNDGYTAFCCEVNEGKNACPPETYIGGWWMCTRYTGHGLCEREGVRYYMDCNHLPGTSAFCQCANGTCAERRTDCNVFRYGQCNTQIGGVTAIKCRVVVCQNPSTIDGFNCSSSVAVDDNTCNHEWPCLTAGLVQQVPGDGEREPVVVLVACETVVLVLLTFLIAGLLRSHAEILKRLGSADTEASQLPEPSAGVTGREGSDIAGTTLAGDAVVIGLGGESPPTLLAFLSSGCGVCGQLWRELRADWPAGVPAATRLVPVVKDPSAESPVRLRALASPSLPVVMSSAAWRDYGVPATPYFVYLEGGRVQGAGSVSAWEEIPSVLGALAA